MIQPYSLAARGSASPRNLDFILRGEMADLTRRANRACVRQAELGQRAVAHRQKREDEHNDQPDAQQ